MTNEERKKAAWQRLWGDKWFGRLFWGTVLLALCGSAVNGLVGGILRQLNVADWQDYAMAVARNRYDVTTPVPNLTADYIRQATSSLSLKLFIGYIMEGIAAYGGAVILCKCLANDGKDWLKEAFGGFRSPFGLLWLFFRRQLINLGWSIVALFPLGLAFGFLFPLLTSAGEAGGVLRVLACSMALSVACVLSLVVMCVPFYRYRYLWLVKAENPDWSAGACLRTCRRLMKGNLAKAFRLDCAYWKPITLLLVLSAVALGGGAASLSGIAPALSGFVTAAALCGAVAASVVLTQYVGVGQAILYRELKDQREGERE